MSFLAFIIQKRRAAMVPKPDRSGQRNPSLKGTEAAWRFQHRIHYLGSILFYPRAGLVMKLGCHRVAGLHFVEIHPNFVIFLVDKFALDLGAAARGPVCVMRGHPRALEEARSLLQRVCRLM